MNKKEQINQYTKDFQLLCCPFGYLDIECAMSIAMEVGMQPEDVIEVVEQFCDDTEVKFKDVDVVAVLLDYILQQARNKIDNYIDFDIQNDAEFDVFGNYLDSTIDFISEDGELLYQKITEADTETQEELLNDTFVQYLLKDIGVFDRFFEVDRKCM